MSSFSSGEKQKGETIFQREGIYIIDEAYVIVRKAPNRSIPLHDALLEVEKSKEGQFIVHGKAMVKNADLVSLLEDYEELDIVIDMGSNFRFYLKDPMIQGGKVFSPTVSSTIRFIPSTSFDPISEEEFIKFRRRHNTL